MYIYYIYISCMLYLLIYESRLILIGVMKMDQVLTFELTVAEKTKLKTRNEVSVLCIQ